MSVATAKSEDTKPKCEVCKKAEPKYRCPGCNMRTCSLPCVKQHKEVYDCLGIRDKTAYVKIKNMTDLNLLSDYRYLEDVGRKTDTVLRDRIKDYKPLVYYLQTLASEAKKRNVILKFLPKVFTKRKKNRTTYLRKTDMMVWSFEWVFPSIDAKHFDKHLETLTLSEALQKLFNPELTDPVVCHKLRGYQKHGVDRLKVLLKKERCQANDQRYYLLDKSKTIKENLSGKLIIEYPTMYVIYSEKVKTYNLVEEEFNSEVSASEEQSGDDIEELTTAITGDGASKDTSQIEHIATTHGNAEGGT